MGNKYLLTVNKQEIGLVAAMLNEVLHGFKLTNDELVLLGDKRIGKSFEDEIFSLRKSQVKSADLWFSFEQLYFCRCAIILVMVKLHEYNLYNTHMGYEFIDCVKLLHNIDEVMLSSN